MAQGLDHCLILSGTLCPQVRHYSQGPTKGKTEKGWTEIYLTFYISLSQIATQSWNSITRTTSVVLHTVYIYATQHRSISTVSSAGHTWKDQVSLLLSLQQPRVECAALSSPKSGAIYGGSGSRHHCSRKITYFHLAESPLFSHDLFIREKNYIPTLYSQSYYKKQINIKINHKFSLTMIPLKMNIN